MKVNNLVPATCPEPEVVRTIPSIQDQFSQQIPADLAFFIRDHADEITRMNKEHRSVGQWTLLGEGVSKAVYSHPEEPNYVFKIPHGKRFIDMFLRHFENMGKAAKLIKANRWKRLQAPEDAYLINSSFLFCIERKMEFERHWRVAETPAKKEAIDQLQAFLRETGICDIDITLKGGNAEFLKGTEDNPKIAIYDFDCKKNPRPY